MVRSQPADAARARPASLQWMLGPAFVAAVAYVDPGNVAANMTAGSKFGYLLVWVLVAANLMAVLVQYLSARLGVIAGASLPQIMGRRLRTGPRWAYWLQAEIVAVATDLAEVVGGAIALKILFDLPLLVGGIVVAAVSVLVLWVQDRRGQRTFETVIVAMLLIVVLGFTAGLLLAPISWPQLLQGVTPRFEGTESVILAASMLGATVMPHAIYAHSALVRDRPDLAQAPTLVVLRATRWDVVGSMVVAGAVNLGMLVLAAAALHGVDGTDTIEGAHHAIAATLGPAIAMAFAIGLLASGLASTSVGAYAGAEIMGGLLHRRVPLVWRRLVTVIPAIVLLGVGAEPTWTLVISQVVLSMGVPFALIPLVLVNQNREVMGEHTISWPLRIIAWLVVSAIVALNLALLVALW